MSTPPPPSGSGGNQPYDPTGQGSTPDQPPAYGSQQPPAYGQGQQYGSGMPPQAPPPGGGFPQQGGSNNGQILSIISVVTGVLGLLCCTWFIFSIAAVVLGFFGMKEYDKTGQKKTLAQVGIGLGIAGIVIGIIYWILIATGVVDSSFEYYSDF